MAQPAASTKVTFVMFESDIIPAIVTTRTMSGASGGTTMESEAWSTRKELVMGGRMNDAADAVSAVKVSNLRCSRSMRALCACSASRSALPAMR